jgi:hypothetical protein
MGIRRLSKTKASFGLILGVENRKFDLQFFNQLI